MSYKKRKTERLEIEPSIEGGDDRLIWNECELIDIRKGDIFRSWEPGDTDGEWSPQIDPGGAVFLAFEDAHLIEGLADDCVGVKSVYVNGFDRMSW